MRNELLLALATLVALPCAAAEHAMTYREMARQMEMDDRSSTGKLLVNHLEWSRVEGTSVLDWEARAWYGNDYDKVLLKTEGAHASEATTARVELLWDRVLSRWWNLQLGVRQDYDPEVARFWLAAGIEGLAPGQIEIEAAAYAADQSRTAFRLTAERDLLITQRLILQPRIETNVYGSTDLRTGVGSGLANVEFALRLRYEPMPQFGFYGGVVWDRSFGATADLARATGRDPEELRWVLGVRLWL